MIRYTIVILFLGFGLMLAPIQNASAADSYQVNNGATVTIDEHGVCQKVTNNIGSHLFVPTKTATEWSTFRSNKPNSVSLGGCCVTEYRTYTHCSTFPGGPNCGAGWTKTHYTGGNRCATSDNTAQEFRYTSHCQREVCS